MLKNNSKMLLLRISLGIIYIWFGTLKLFPDLSPAEQLAKSTLDLLSFGLVSTDVTYFVLALWEIGLGILLLFNLVMKVAVPFALLHMLGTFFPLILIPDQVFQNSLGSLTLVGQYIFKNLVLVSGLLLLCPKNLFGILKLKR